MRDTRIIDGMKLSFDLGKIARKGKYQGIGTVEAERISDLGDRNWFWALELGLDTPKNELERMAKGEKASKGFYSALTIAKAKHYGEEITSRESMIEYLESREQAKRNKRAECGRIVKTIEKRYKPTLVEVRQAEQQVSLDSHLDRHSHGSIDTSHTINTSSKDTEALEFAEAQQILARLAARKTTSNANLYNI
jgi:hypothetical protein